jgi:hypothetical protein
LINAGYVLNIPQIKTPYDDRPKIIDTIFKKNPVLTSSLYSQRKTTGLKRLTIVLRTGIIDKSRIATNTVPVKTCVYIPVWKKRSECR